MLNYEKNTNRQHELPFPSVSVLYSVPDIQGKNALGTAVYKKNGFFNLGYPEVCKEPAPSEQWGGGGEKLEERLSNKNDGVNHLVF